MRYLLFGELLAAKSAVFWYDETLADPTGWHSMFFEFVGLEFPNIVVEKAASAAANAAISGGTLYGFPLKGMDKHTGGGDPQKSRTFRDEVSPTTLSRMDDVLRVWLPPVMLATLGVIA